MIKMAARKKLSEITDFLVEKSQRFDRLIFENKRIVGYIVKILL